LTHDFGEQRFDLFLFLDSLEHMENLKAISQKVRAIAADGFIIFGNVPLYPSHHDTMAEYPMNINILKQFIYDCGLSGLHQRIYGINGYPYMVFEAK